jgi:hypothetical protein
MRIATFNTMPNSKDNFWQLTLLPTAAILKSVDSYDPYTAITLEWLFWSVSFIIGKNDKRSVH